MDDPEIDDVSAAKAVMLLTHLAQLRDRCAPALLEIKNLVRVLSTWAYSPDTLLPELDTAMQAAFLNLHSSPAFLALLDECQHLRNEIHSPAAWAACDDEHPDLQSALEAEIESLSDAELKEIWGYDPKFFTA
ncbi:MAG: hypothetical protein QOD99_2358 [Chthoniobacter sp.]|jgi:hypothetical protein|nr:hypothetical protein [Chthoniobacter sp.]